MIKPAIIAGFLALLGVGCVLAPVAVSARSVGSHAAAHPPSSAAQAMHHRFNKRTGFWGYYPYGSYGSYGDGSYAAPPPPSTEKPVAENRRDCEPQIYSVPSSDGGESKVTIVRC